MVYTIKETESLSMKGGKPQLSTAVLEDCKTEPSSMIDIFPDYLHAF